MRTQLVYDLPTRIFHWLFVILFLFAFVIGKTVDDESVIFSYHMLAGLTIGFLIILRLVWGVLGTKHSRFRDFSLNPKELVSYFKGIFTGSKRKWTGHNPASSWAAIIMIAFATGLAITGFLMASGVKKKILGEPHELLANGLIIVVIAHILGVLFHWFRHRDGIAFSMIDGKKSGVSANDTISSSKSLVGILALILVALFGFNLISNFDANERRLDFFGKSLKVGDKEKHHKHSKKVEIQALPQEQMSK